MTVTPLLGDTFFGEYAAFRHQGAAGFRAAAVADLPLLIAALEKWDTRRPGVRIGDAGLLRHFLTRQGVVGQIAAALAGDGMRPVRAVLFDKNPAANWSLGWH